MRIAMFKRNPSNSKSARRQRRRARNLMLGFEHLDARRVLAAITGVVYNDLDVSGAQDVNEAGLENRIVYIDLNHDSRFNDDEPYRLTDGSGGFEFADLQANSFSVRMFDGTNTQPLTTPAFGLHSVDLATDSSVVDIRFGVELLGDNNAPASDPVTYETQEGRSFVLPIVNGLVMNHGSDAENHTFIALQTSDAQNGTIDIDLMGDFRYLAVDDFAGEDTVTYILHDGRDASDPLTLTVNVVADGEPLQGIVATGAPVLENSPVGTVLGTLTVLTPSLQGNVRFESLDSRVQIEDNLLILAEPAVLNFEENPELRFVVQVIDLETNENVMQREIVIQLADANDPIKTVTGPGYGETFEYTTGTVFGSVDVDDEDSGETHLVHVNDGRFEVVDGVLKLRDDQALSYPDDDGLVLTVFVNDPAQAGAAVSDDVTISVYNVNDPPTAVNASGEVREQTLGAIVGPVTVIDPDPNDSYTFLTSDARFEVVDGVLKLMDDQAVVYDSSTPSITFTLTATEISDSNYSVESVVTIPITQSSAPWQNLPESLDVNNDGQITPQDVLIILNSLNEGGPRALQVPFEGSHYLDVNGDGLLTPLDALIVVNELNNISSVRELPGGGFPPIGEAEEPAGNDSILPEGEAIAESPKSKSSGQSSADRFAAPSQAQPLLVADTDAFDEHEDWLEPNLEDLLV